MIDFKDDILLDSTLREWKQFVKKARDAFRRGELDSVRNSMSQKPKWNGK